MLQRFALGPAGARDKMVDMPIDLSASLAASDPEIAVQIQNEIRRQHEGLEMIA